MEFEIFKPVSQLTETREYKKYARNKRDRANQLSFYGEFSSKSLSFAGTSDSSTAS